MLTAVHYTMGMEERKRMSELLCEGADLALLEGSFVVDYKVEKGLRCPVNFVLDCDGIVSLQVFDVRHLPRQFVSTKSSQDYSRRG
jgi:hypothetical protein